MGFLGFGKSKQKSKSSSEAHSEQQSTSDSVSNSNATSFQNSVSDASNGQDVLDPNVISKLSGAAGTASEAFSEMFSSYQEMYMPFQNKILDITESMAEQQGAAMSAALGAMMKSSAVNNKLKGTMIKNNERLLKYSDASTKAFFKEAQEGLNIGEESDIAGATAQQATEQNVLGLGQRARASGASSRQILDAESEVRQSGIATEAGARNRARRAAIDTNFNRLAGAAQLGASGMMSGGGETNFGGLIGGFGQGIAGIGSLGRMDTGADFMKAGISALTPGTTTLSSGQSHSESAGGSQSTQSATSESQSTGTQDATSNAKGSGSSMKFSLGFGK